MPIKKYKPTSPGRRFASAADGFGLDKKRPLKSLTIFLKERAGRNSQGKITVRHKGGGAKRLFRIIDFKRDKFDIEAKVVSLEYDPNRSANIGLLQYQDGEKRYILAPDGLKVGDKIFSSRKRFDIKIGNTLPLLKIPTGTSVHNIELTAGSGGVLVRGAGEGAMLQSKEFGFAQIKLPSGEIRLVRENCMATIGQLGNADFRNIRLGKAGRKRLLGIRPSVRGKAMNPVDHPHGGGEGNQPIGLKGPKSVYGWKALGVKTRSKGKYSDRFIIKRRS